MITPSFVITGSVSVKGLVAKRRSNNRRAQTASISTHTQTHVYWHHIMWAKNIAVVFCANPEPCAKVITPEGPSPFALFDNTNASSPFTSSPFVRLLPVRRLKQSQFRKDGRPLQEVV